MRHVGDPHKSPKTPFAHTVCARRAGGTERGVTHVSWPAASSEALRCAGCHRAVLPRPPQPHGAHQRATEKVGTAGRAGVTWAGDVRGQKHLLPSHSSPTPPPLLRASGPVTAQPSPLSKGLASPRTPTARGDPARHKAPPLGSPHPDPGVGHPDQWEPACSGFWLGAWRACPHGAV